MAESSPRVALDPGVEEFCATPVLVGEPEHFAAGIARFRSIDGDDCAETEREWQTA